MAYFGAHLSIHQDAGQIPIAFGQELVGNMLDAGQDVVFVPLTVAKHSNIVRYPQYQAQMADFVEYITQK